jgi:TonB-linked SusC/RagA family outer membrane protein
MARLNYSYNNKYLLTVSGRNDGASQLAEGHKWAFFPSGAIGWRLDKEDFMADVNWVNQLKLRFGVGVTGNSAIAPYSTKGRLDAMFYPFGSTSTAGQMNVATMANQDLGWEKTTQYNVGLDFSLLKSRIYGNLDVYTSNTNDLLLQKSIPTVTGFSSTFANVGETKSKGVDLTLNTVNITSNDFEWTTNFNFTYQENEIVSLANGKEDDLNNLWFIGYSQNIIYGYESAGIWQDSDAAEMAKFNANGHTFSAGNVRPKDQNGDYKIDANNDRVIIGNEIPKYILGMTNTFNYKNIELSVFLYGRMGYTYNAGGEGMVGRYQQRKVDYWTPDNTNSDYQKPIYSEGYGDIYYASLGYESGSFLKIRNISLGYNLPNKATDKLGISKLRIYVQALDPGFIFNNVPWIDLDLRYHASNRGFVAGISAQF